MKVGVGNNNTCRMTMEEKRRKAKARAEYGSLLIPVLVEQLSHGI